MKNKKQPELKVHIGKRTLKIDLKNIPLTSRAREITEKYIKELTDELKLDYVIIDKAKPYKTQPKPKKEEKPENEEMVKIDYEKAKKDFEELEKLMNSFGELK